MKTVNITNLVPTVIVLIVLIVIGVIIKGSGTSPAIVIGKEPMNDLPLSRIGSIVITKNSDQSKDTLTLKRADEQWVVVNRNGYPADPDRIEKFIREFKDMKVLRELTAGKNQLGRVGLLDPDDASVNSATRVTLLKSNGDMIRTLHLGKELSGPGSENQTSQQGFGGFPDRRFVMIDNKRSEIVVVDQTFSNASPSPSDWLNKDFLKVDKPNSIEVIYPGDESTNSWKITKSSDVAEWELFGNVPEGKVLDTGSTPTSPLSSPSFNDLATEAEKSQLDKNATQIKIGTFDGLNYHVKIGQTASGNDRIIQVKTTATFPKSRISGENEKAEDKANLDKEWKEKQEELKEKLRKEAAFNKNVYRVSSYTVESILKKKSDLLKDNEKAEPSSSNEPPVPFIKPPQTTEE